jgi:hypothetical protein
MINCILAGNAELLQPVGEKPMVKLLDSWSFIFPELFSHLTEETRGKRPLKSNI